VDLTTLPENKLAWRPAKESSRWKVESRREEWEAWRGWRRDVVRKAAVAAPRRAQKPSNRDVFHNAEPEIVQQEDV
jgi:hypothetical protein